MTESLLLERCRNSGLRVTKALTTLLHVMHTTNRPMTLNELREAPHLQNVCDPATIFRLIQRLTDKGIVRRLGLHSRAAYFTLLIPGEHHDYLICTECGSIQSIEAPCPVHNLQREIYQHTGYQNLYHELEFFGTCPECQPNPTQN